MAITKSAFEAIAVIIGKEIGNRPTADSATEALERLAIRDVANGLAEYFGEHSKLFDRTKFVTKIEDVAAVHRLTVLEARTKAFDDYKKLTEPKVEPLNEVELADGPHLTYEDRFDSLFKSIITGGWNVKSDGEVDSPAGYFALVEIPSHHGELLEMRKAMDAEDGEEWPHAGWYFTYEDELGFIHVYKAQGKHYAEVAYLNAAKVYSEWQDEDPA